MFAHPESANREACTASLTPHPSLLPDGTGKVMQGCKGAEEGCFCGGEGAFSGGEGRKGIYQAWEVEGSVE